MSFLKNRTVVGILCILLSLLICFGVTPLFNKAVSKKTEIVRVTKEIKVGDEITKDMVQIAEVGGYGLPENVIRQTETVVGKYAIADLSVGDYMAEHLQKGGKVEEVGELINEGVLDAGPPFFPKLEDVLPGLFDMKQAAQFMADGGAADKVYSFLAQNKKEDLLQAEPPAMTMGQSL